MGLTDESRKDIVAYRIERAYTALDQAKKNVQIKCLEVTANRLYYAAYYAVSALLIAYGIRTRSHEGNIGQFGLNFVQKGVFPKEMGRFYNNLFTMRLTGDYDDRFNLTEDDVLPKIELTETFIEKVVNLTRDKMKEEEDGG